jgi:hypothetical protein
MSRDEISQNNAERERLLRLTRALSVQELSKEMDDGWTVATGVAHLAFWDRRAALLLDRWSRGNLPPRREPGWDTPEVLNEALLPQWRALAPVESVRLALEAAAAVDLRVEKLDPRIFEEIAISDESWLVKRFRHRREHLDQIERALRP